MHGLFSPEVSQKNISSHLNSSFIFTLFLIFTFFLMYVLCDLFHHLLPNYYLTLSQIYGSAYLQSMDFQREPQSKHHLYFLDCFFLPLGQPDPTRPISLTLTQTPTPADREVPVHSWRPLGHSTVWADFVRVSGSVLYLVRTQSKK